MQITQTSAEGLKREHKVVIGRDELSARLDARLDEVKERIQLKGFRKGKVPFAHIKKLYGRSVMAEVLQQAVADMTQQVLAERKERAAHQPRIAFSEDKAEIDSVLAGQSDLAYTMSYETLPEITLADLSLLRLEREVADVAPEAVDRAVADLLERATRYEPAPERSAAAGDRLTIDFAGRVDGEEFEGGKGEDVQLILGEGAFIPGFSEGLLGCRSGEERLVNAKFPVSYPQAQLAGKDAVFTVKVKEVAQPIRQELNDEFAKTLGAESLANLRAMVGQRIASEYAGISGMKLKRRVLDALDKAYDFALPESLVASEYEALWAQLTRELKETGKTLADAGKGEEEVRAEYRRLAERRVRLGLLLGEIGDKASLQVSQEELRHAMVEQARRYPGREKMVYEYYQNNPAALIELRAPIFEDKVLEHIVRQANPIDRKVSAPELLRPIDDGDALLGRSAPAPDPLAREHPSHDHAHAHGDHAAVGHAHGPGEEGHDHRHDHDHDPA
jgi:trigger factor